MTLRTDFDLLYHGPHRRKSGLVHLHVKEGERFETDTFTRTEGESLCGLRSVYELPANSGNPCLRCYKIAVRRPWRETA